MINKKLFKTVCLHNRFIAFIFGFSGTERNLKIRRRKTRS